LAGALVKELFVPGVMIKHGEVGVTDRILELVIKVCDWWGGIE